MSAIPKAMAQSASTVFTAATLSKYNGQNGQPIYFAYKGKVYDATGYPDWGAGKHYEHLAGTDLTAAMAGAPHAEDVVNGLQVVGTYQAAQASPLPIVAKYPRPWYASPMMFLNISVLGWTSILLAIVFVLNFATCFALPWSNNPLPWTGERPGPDPLDASGVHLRWTATHKFFAWATVVVGLVHGLIGFMQMLGYRL
jgi:predicted heme/steroid binding protein